MLTHLDFYLAGARVGLKEGLYHRVDNERSTIFSKVIAIHDVPDCSPSSLPSSKIQNSKGFKIY